MREQRLSAETNRAKKEMQFYEQKRDLSKKINKMQDKRVKDIQKLEEAELKVTDTDELESIQKKKAKNLEKMFNYQSRKDARTFKQRVPITHDHFQGESKR